MAYNELTRSRDRAQPVTLFLFQGDVVSEFQIENLLKGVTVIPGTTEFGYATTKITKDFGGGLIEPENWLSNQPDSDMVVAIQQLIDRAPNVEHVSLVVAWHGTDLRIGSCQVKPRVERAEKDTEPRVWQVAGLTRASAEIVSQISGNPAAGGAPADWSIYEAVTFLKSKGLRVTLYPFILMDIPEGNTLPNPYSDNAELVGQPQYPWRGRITCSPAAGFEGSVDKTSAAADQVAAFFGSAGVGDFSFNDTLKIVTYSGPNEWSFRRFVLHMATIGAAAGADDFLIGTEMVGMTTIRSSESEYPSVTQLKTLAADVRSILGGGVRISYAADWSEYHSHRPSDGSGDVFFHLDPLWSDDNIDFVGIDNYLPISDWRDGEDHLDFYEGFKSIYDIEYLESRIEGGEAYDWFYQSFEDRQDQKRTPIFDSAEEKHWVFRQKDIRNWWGELHYNRPGGVESGTPTAWVPQSKPIVFTELGCPAVDKGTNQPNVFVDPKSSESFIPFFSDGIRDELIQRAYLEAWHRYWSGENNPISSVYSGSMIDMDSAAVWTWDARPYPAFPARSDFWQDSMNWQLGHWINGRIQQTGEAMGRITPFAYTDAVRPFEFQGIEYQPVPITCGKVNASGKLDKSQFEVRLPRTAEIADLFRVYPPSQPVTLIVRQGNLNDDDREFLVAWAGRVLSSKREGNEIVFVCEPTSSSLRRPGLRRTYQIGCPHALYGAGCHAPKNPVSTTVAAISPNTITFSPGWHGALSPEKFLNGIVEWDTSEGTREIRRVLRITGDTATLAGVLTGLGVGDSVSVLLGCNHTVSDCLNLHNNIHNFGGCPTIPLQNPLSPGFNVFY